MTSSYFVCVCVWEQEAAVALGVVSAEQFEEWVRPEKMLGPSD